MKRIYAISLYISFFFVFVSGAAAQDVSSGLEIYYPFKNGEATDMSGNSNHAVIRGNAEESKGVRDDAVRLLGQGVFGEKGGHMELPDIGVGDLNEFSVCFWIKYIGHSHPEGCSFFMFGNLEEGWAGMRSHLDTKSEDAERGIIASAGNGPPEIIDFDKKDFGQWIFYTYIYDNGNVKIYRNETLVKSFSRPLDIGAGGGSIGRTVWDADSLFSTRFVGDIDEFRLYSRALSFADVRYLFKPCEIESMDFPSFDSEEKIKLVGTANLEDGYIRLTEYIAFQKGAVWFKEKVKVEKGFTTEFSFRMSDGFNASARDNSLPGADGFAFVIQNGDGEAIGEWGGGLGYNGLNNALAVEFDFFNNSFDYDPDEESYDDPNGNHISVQCTGMGEPVSSSHDTLHMLAMNKDIFEMQIDGTEYFVKIDYDVVPRTLRVFLGEEPNYEEPIITVEDIDLGEMLRLDCRGAAFVGFTGATGKSYQNQDILSWSFCPFFFVKQLPEIGGKRFACSTNPIDLYIGDEYKPLEWSTGSGSHTITVDEGGLYSVRAQDTAGCWRRQDIFVTFYEVDDPAIEIIGDHPFCDGGNVLLRTINKFAHYKWSTGDTTRSIKVENSGIYSVAVADTNGCEATAEKEVIVWPNPEPVIQTDASPPYCTGDTVTLSLAEEYAEYEWNTGDTTRSIRVHRQGLYWVDVVDENGCEATSSNKDMIFRYTPDPEIDGPESVCEFNEMNYSIDPFENSTIVWTIEGGGVVSGQGGEEIAVRWGESGDGKVIVSQISEFGCEGRDTMQVRIDSTLYPKIKPEDPHFCRGKSVILSAGSGYKEYHWSNGENAPEIEVTQAGFYWVRVVGESGCEGVSDTVRVRMYENPDPVIEGNPEICRGDSAVLSSMNEYARYEWSTGDTTRSITIKNEGEYELVVTTRYGCTGSDSRKVEFRNAKFSGADAVSFGVVYIERDKNKNLNLTNIADYQVTFADARIAGNSAGDISYDVTPQPSQVIAPGENINIDLTFAPQSEKDYFDTLRLIFSIPCRDTLAIPISGTGLRYTFEGFFRLPDLVGEVGNSEFVIPFYGKINRKDTAVTIESINFELRFDSGIFRPDSIKPGDLNDNYIQADDRVLDITLNQVALDGNEKVLTRIYGLVLIGENQKVPLRAKEFVWTTENPYKISDGSMRLGGVCQPGLLPIRLRPVSSIRVYPNPASGDINIDLKMAGSAAVKIFDIHGKVVKSRQLSRKATESGQISIDLGDLPSGVYRISASAGGKFVTTGFILY
jgi:hypothetical protein